MFEGRLVAERRQVLWGLLLLLFFKLRKPDRSYSEKAILKILLSSVNELRFVWTG